MFIESAFITREFREEEIPVLENVTCLSVVNTGNTAVIINGIWIAPKQIQVLILPDGTYSRVQIQKEFITQSHPIFKDENLIKKVDGNNNPLMFKYDKRILLIYKKLI